MENQILVYIAAVAAFGFLFFLWVHNRISKLRDHRIRRAENLDAEQVGAFPVEDLSRKEQQKRLGVLTAGVAQRFTIIGRSIYLMLGLVWVLALSFPFMGSMPTTYVSIAITIATVVLGIAARPFIENFFSGIVISFSHQLRVGDTLIIDEQYGTVEDISITYTKIKTWESKRYIIPNSRMLSKEFINLTLTEQSLWATVNFSVSYDADLDRVAELAEEIAAELSPKEAPEAPLFWVQWMEKDCLECRLTCWAESPAAAWMLRSDMARSLAGALRGEGIATNINHIRLPSRSAL